MRRRGACRCPMTAPSPTPSTSWPTWPESPPPSGSPPGWWCCPAHHPVIMAKRLATVDQLSKGRVRLCIGVGWMREELEACGVDFASRGRRTDECIDVLRALWADTEPEGASFQGEFFHFSHAHTHPKPFRPGGVPIHIGGHSPPSIRRAARRGDGWQPLGLCGGIELATMRSTALHEETEAAGRDPGGARADHQRHASTPGHARHRAVQARRPGRRPFGGDVRAGRSRARPRTRWREVAGRSLGLVSPELSRRYATTR